MDWFRVAQDRQAWQKAILAVFPVCVPDSHRTVILNRWNLSAGRPNLPPPQFNRTRQRRHRGNQKDPATGQYTCPVCNQQFPKVPALRAHYDAEHSVSDPSKITLPTYSCTDCGQVWPNEKLRRQHVCPVNPQPKRIPRPKVQVACRRCGLSMSHTNIGRHEETCRGSDLANRTCSCNRVFSSVVSRKNHENKNQ